MAGAGEGSFDRQEDFVFQEIVYSGGEAAGNATRAAKRSLPTRRRMPSTDAFIHTQAATLPLDESGADK